MEAMVQGKEKVKLKNLKYVDGIWKRQSILADSFIVLYISLHRVIQHDI